ncbi:MAG: CRISPR-associated protein Cas4 [Candidatus Hydrogenedentes bacterium]|nr:CRISPR-associated protein Cas4 [Candidatus Hydrogenedentota bacterium]
MYEEDDLLPISALQSLSFCERQWALIHIECQWEDNRLTVEGNHLHERVHQSEEETRGDVQTTRGLRLRSLRLGLTGQADVVEFHQTAQGRQVYPVEYKRGRPKPTRCDEVQLCGQALCLEEMLNCQIPEGAIFYGQPRRRYLVSFDASLREETANLAKRMHLLFRAGKTPPAVYESKCDNCAQYNLCLPKQTAATRKLSLYMRELFEPEASDSL